MQVDGKVSSALPRLATPPRSTEQQKLTAITEPIPDLTPFMKPSTLGDIATYTFLGAGGVFFGGETGLLTGTFSARRMIGKDRESRERIETAFRKFRADSLRLEANMLDKGQTSLT